MGLSPQDGKEIMVNPSHTSVLIEIVLWRWKQ